MSNVFVVMDGGICGKPVYVAGCEDQVKKWLDKREEEAKAVQADGLRVNRKNSLTLEVSQRNGYHPLQGDYETVSTECHPDLVEARV